MNKCVLNSYGTLKPTEHQVIQEVDAHATIHSVTRTLQYFNIQRGLLFWSLSSIRPLPPKSAEWRLWLIMTLSHLCNLQVGHQSLVRQSSRRALRSDKGGYKKSHPLLVMDMTVISSWLIVKQRWPKEVICSFVCAHSWDMKGGQVKWDFFMLLCCPTVENK